MNSGVIGVGGNRETISLTIYQAADDLQGDNALSQAAAELREDKRVKIRESDVPAVVGKLAGRAVEILVSEPVLATLALAEIGRLLSQAVTAAKKLGKKAALSKPASMAVGLFHAKKSADQLDDEVQLQAAKVWGPMEVMLESELPEGCVEAWDGATSPYGTFMGVAIPVPRERVRTFWYLMGPDGTVCAQWQTQTLRSRVPDILRPDIPAGNGT